MKGPTSLNPKVGVYANFTKMNAEGNNGSGNAIALQPTPKIAAFNPTMGNLGLSCIRNKSPCARREPIGAAISPHTTSTSHAWYTFANDCAST